MRTSTISHPISPRTTTTAPDETIFLVGNPNVGKSALFRNLTGHYVAVSNFPGTTVEIVRARSMVQGRPYTFVDTPGLNDLWPRSDDARVTAALLAEHPGATILQVADAKNLRRALFLTLQLAELGHPMVLVLNMMDELEARGGKLDAKRLAAILRIPVVETVASRDRGTPDVLDSLPAAREPVTGLGPGDPPPDTFDQSRRLLGRAQEILAETLHFSRPRVASLSVRLGFMAMHPVQGVAILAAMLVLVFWLVGLFGAGTLVDLLESGLFEQRVTPAAIHAVDAALPFDHVHETATLSHPVGIPLTPVHERVIATLSREATLPAYSLSPEEPLGPLGAVLRFVHDFLVGEYGLITMALGYAIAIVLPIVAIFFLVFSLLEDSGYLPRMAIMVNRIFRAMGLNGKAVLPMILGLGCDTMATMTTRILETRRERIVTTLLLALAIPCSAQLGVLLALTTALSIEAALLWVALMVGIIFLVGWLSSRLFRTRSSEFVLEVPPLRLPQLSNVLVKTYSRLSWYLREVVPLFVLGTAMLFLLDRLGLLTRIARLGEPIVVSWLGLPREVTNAFLVGFLRRDFGAIYILDAATGPEALLSAHQIFVVMVTITLFVPCIANVFMIAREHGARIALGMVAFIFPFAFLVGGLVHHIGRWWGGLG